MSALGKMNLISILLAGVSIVSAQSLTDLPPCGQVCVSNMIKIASTEFGCSVGDSKCYCTNERFGYGIRDCSNESCPPGDAPKVISYGTNYCSAILAGSSVSAPTPTGVPGPSGTSGGNSASGSHAGTGVSSSAITTIPLVATSIGSGTTLVMTTGSSTVYSGINGAASTLLSSLSSEAGSASTHLGSVSSVFQSITSAINSISSSQKPTSTSSTGGAPVKTAAPFWIGAGLAALLAV